MKAALNRDFDLVSMVCLAWDDLVALHKHVEANPALRDDPAHCAELLKAHHLYVDLFTKWAAQ